MKKNLSIGRTLRNRTLEDGKVQRCYVSVIEEVCRRFKREGDWKVVY